MAKKFTLEWWQNQRPEVVGKATEQLVEDCLRERNKWQNFAWSRFPDSKSARAVIAAQPADYLAVSKGVTTLLEVKASKHPKLLQKDRVSQLPTLHKFALAGANTLIIVHQYLEGVWRAIPATELELGRPSWDITVFPAFDNAFHALEAAL